MIVAGCPGTALLDVGEGEDSNLATGQAMAEQRRRFLRRRQSYLGWLLADLVIVAWERYATTRGLSRRAVTTADVTVDAPDISPEDNQALAGAAQALTSALLDLGTLTGESEALARLALRLFVKFTGETVSEQEFEAVVQDGARDKAQRVRVEREGSNGEPPRPSVGSRNGTRPVVGDAAGRGG